MKTITDMGTWNTSERGDLMLEFAQKLGCPLPLLTLAKGKCAETVLHLMRDERSRNAVKIAIDFGNGAASRVELFAAAIVADAVANAADYAADAANAYAAAAAANAATDYEADAPAVAAENAAAAYYTDTADADAAKKENQKQTANICRMILTDFIKSKLI